MKNRVRILAWLYIVVCGGLLLAGAVICTAMFLPSSHATAYTKSFLGGMVSCFAIVLIPGFIGGLGLLRYRQWARVLLLVVSAPLITLPPIGTALGVFAFWTLLSPDVDADFGVAGRRPLLALFPINSPALNLIGLMACVGAGMLLALKVGFAVHNQPEPFELGGTASTAGAILIIAIGCVVGTIQAVSRRHNRRAPTQPSNQGVGFIVDENDRRYGRPDRRDVDHSPYWDVTGRHATCEHLHKIEKQLADAGVSVTLLWGKHVMAKCRIEGPEFDRSCASPPIRYAEYLASDERSAERPTAYIMCDEHKSMINTVHPQEPGSGDAPWFPPSI